MTRSDMVTRLRAVAYRHAWTLDDTAAIVLSNDFCAFVSLAEVDGRIVVEALR